MSFLLGAVLVLSVFLLIGASKAKNEGRYQTYEPLLWTLIVTCVAAGVCYVVLSKPWKRMHDNQFK